MAKKNPHIGGDFDEFLAEEGLLEDAELLALKRVLAYQIEEHMKAKGMSKAQMARVMNTSRASLDRLLDPENTSVTFRTLGRAARAVGARLKIGLAA
jgi:predicted XRE-type DNA-binding protein